MTNIYLLRHGESVANIEGAISSRLPGSKLADSGKEQTKIVGEEIKKINFHKIYCSPFKRTMETALLLNELVEPKEIIVDDRIKEIDYGCYDGLIKKEEFIALTLDRILKGDNTIRFGICGENENEILSRIISFLIEIIKQKKDVLVVSHQSIISIILQIRNLIDVTKNEADINNCFFYKTAFEKSDIKFLNKYIQKFNEVHYSSYTLIKKDLAARARFYPSVDLPVELTITTPFTFPFYDDQVMLSFDKMGWWNPLGGHIEEGETWEETLKREAAEEAGVDIDEIIIVGYILIEHLTETGCSKYPSKSIIPVTASKIVKIDAGWKPRETKERNLFSFTQAKKVLKSRSDNKQMLEIFNYIIKYGLYK